MSGASVAPTFLAPWRAERILYDERGLLVVDKPIGVPTYGGDEGLAHGLTARLGAFLEANGRPPRLGVHSRLDQATSGACLLTTDGARDAEVAAALASRGLSRRYVALVLEPSRRLPPEGTIRLSLAKRGGRAVVVPRGGQEAVTHYRVIERVGPRALLSVWLETGRMHQIRASLASLGTPLVGDELYGGPAAARLFLHAVAISGAPLPRPVEAELPLEFRQMLETGQIEPPGRPHSLIWDAVCLRAPLAAHSDTYRLVNGEGDLLPGLTVDRFGDFAVMNVYDERWLAQQDDVVAALSSAGFAGVYVKRRLRADLREVAREVVASDAPVCGVAAPRELVVGEAGLRMIVDLADGLSTGLFVDQRDNHRKTRTWARGGEMLNLFCYTSAFSVAAAQVGARTTSVDLSGRALERSRANFVQNGLDPGKHRFFKEDAMKYLARAVRRGDRFSFIVLDPPSFATVGKGTFTVKGRYREAAAHCVALLAPFGKLLCVTNHTGTSVGQLTGLLRDVVRESGRTLRSLRQLPSGLDCPPGSEGPFPSKSIVIEVE